MALQPGRCLLNDLLKEKGLTQVELSDKTGYSQPMLSKFATNERTMSLVAARIISEVMKCNIEDLYDWDPNLLESKGNERND